MRVTPERESLSQEATNTFLHMLSQHIPNMQVENVGGEICLSRRSWPYPAQPIMHDGMDYTQAVLHTLGTHAVFLEIREDLVSEKAKAELERYQFATIEYSAFDPAPDVEIDVSVLWDNSGRWTIEQTLAQKHVEQLVRKTISL